VLDGMSLTGALRNKLSSPVRTNAARDASASGGGGGRRVDASFDVPVCCCCCCLCVCLFAL
jgi:hypothetical protein